MIQAIIARIEAQLQKELQRLRADIEGLHRQLVDVSNSMAANARDEEHRSATLHQELKDGLHAFNGNMQVRRRRIKQASSILEEIVKNKCNHMRVCNLQSDTTLKPTNWQTSKNLCSTLEEIVDKNSELNKAVDKTHYKELYQTLEARLEKVTAE